MCDEEELETPSSSVKCQHIMTIFECMEWRVEPSAAGEVAGLILLIVGWRYNPVQSYHTASRPKTAGNK